MVSVGMNGISSLMLPGKIAPITSINRIRDISKSTIILSGICAEHVNADLEAQL